MAKLGLQLYTVRDVADKDLPGAMRQVAQIGYDGVEFAGGVMQTPANVIKKTLAETGLTVAGAVFLWNELENNLKGIISYCKEIGCPTVVFPWIDEKLRLDRSGWLAVAQQFNAWARECRANGLNFLYHVHGYEFSTVEGKTGMDWLMETIDPKLVQLEIDVYWVEHAGVDSVEFMKKWGHLSPSIHFKDMKDRASKMDTEVGAGAIDMLAIARIGKQHNARWFIVEQEQFDMPSMESVAISLRNLKKVVQKI
jgi:sugar phosphate isomerase/epimerase